MNLKTVEQARALPEVESDNLIGRDYPNNFPRQAIQGDDIAYFTDADGRSMRVTQRPDIGWCKVAV